MGMTKMTLTDLHDFIVSTAFYVFYGTHTVCALKLQNGQTVTGESAPQLPEEFDQKDGQDRAYEDAIRKAWPQFICAMRTRYMDREDVDPPRDTE